MKWLKHLLVAWWIAVLGMAGGQGKVGGKAPRRFGIPVLALAVGGFSQRAWPMLFLIPILMMGYGEDSFLMDLLGVDWLVRLVYATLLSLPFAFYGFTRWLWAILSLVAAFQMRAGSLGHIGWFGDLLIEDAVRYGTLGVLAVFNLTFPVQK